MTWNEAMPFVFILALVTLDMLRRAYYDFVDWRSEKRRTSFPHDTSNHPFRK